jgi:uncharacterized membrane protein
MNISSTLKKALYLAGVTGAISSYSLHAQTMTDLGNLGGTFSSARAVSADGSVIVGPNRPWRVAWHNYCVVQHRRWRQR